VEVDNMKGIVAKNYIGYDESLQQEVMNELKQILMK
jgi:hypothetical protein